MWDRLPFFLFDTWGYWGCETTGVRDRTRPLARWLQILFSVLLLLLLLKLAGLYWVCTPISKKCCGNPQVLEVYTLSLILKAYISFWSHNLNHPKKVRTFQASVWLVPTSIRKKEKEAEGVTQPTGIYWVSFCVDTLGTCYMLWFLPNWSVSGRRL